MKFLLQKCLDERGLTAYKLARLLTLSDTTVYGWLRGRAWPSPDNVDRICQALDITPGDLFEAEPAKERQLPEWHGHQLSLFSQEDSSDTI